MSSPTPPPYGGSPQPGSSASPIADLSYRNYDGPLQTRAVRWWIVSLANIRLITKKPGFWVLAAIACLPFLAQGVILFFAGNLAPGGGALFGGAPTGQKYATLFYTALQPHLFFIFLIGLMAGTGSIAADNKANALIVYLSKPITKGDYLLGKWMGIFLVLFAVTFVPSILLYGFCLLSYASSGFLKDEPLLLFRVLGICVIPGVVHASLLVGFSAWSKTPSMAGSFYAGLYFISSAISTVVAATISGGNPMRNPDIMYLSVPGVINGLAQNVLGITDPASRRFGGDPVPAPNALLLIALGTLFVLGGLAAARAKINAVEVVKG